MTSLARAPSRPLHKWPPVKSAPDDHGAAATVRHAASRIITDYRLLEKRNISAYAMYSTNCVNWAVDHFVLV